VIQAGQENVVKVIVKFIESEVKASQEKASNQMVQKPPSLF
jgi:hypothetical protein